MFNLESYCNIEYSFASLVYCPYTPVYLSFSKELLLLPHLFCSSLTCSYVLDQLTFYTLPILLPFPRFLVVCISIQVALSLFTCSFNLILTFTCMISSYFSWTECYVGNGESYRGSLSETVIGTSCQKWSKSSDINAKTHPGKVCELSTI